MSKLRKTTLAHNNEKGSWDLKEDKTNRVVKRFDLKEDATKGGSLEKALGKEGGSVKIKKLDGTFQEERTFPGSQDPSKSKG